MPTLLEQFEDGESEEIYKILRQSEVDNQHMICDDAYTYYVYRPYISDYLPRFIVGFESASGRNPAAVGEIAQTMVGGVVEAPVEGQIQSVDPVPGNLVYCAYDATRADPPYLTVDSTDVNVVGCWGIVIDDQRPIHYGEGRANLGAYSDLYSVKILTCCYLNSTLYAERQV